MRPRRSNKMITPASVFRVTNHTPKPSVHHGFTPIPSCTSNKADRAACLPAAGYRNESNLNDAGSNGNYWSSSLYTDNPNNAYDLYFNDGNVNAQNNDNRYYGQSVRAVRRRHRLDASKGAFCFNSQFIIHNS